MTMVLPNMKHAWGFAGFKDQHDKLRREADASIEDGCRNADSGRVRNNELDKARRHIHQVMARRAKRKQSKEKPTCSYCKCSNPNDPLLPCEQPGRCPNYLHARCCARGKLICSICARKQKRRHDTTPTEVAKSTRSVAKSARLSRDDPVRVALFQREDTTNPPAAASDVSATSASAVVTSARFVSPGTSMSPSRIVTPSVFVTTAAITSAPESVPATPSNSVPVTPASRVDDDIDTPVEDMRRPGRGGPGRVAATPFEPGSGSTRDPFQKQYNKCGKRSTDVVFDAVKYARVQKRKANAVDHFFAIAQDEKNRVDGAVTVGPDEIAGAFGTKIPTQTRYKYRGHAYCNKLQELLMTMQFLKCATSFDDLAYKWLGGGTKVLRTAAQNICYTWVAFFFAILEKQPMWISPERADKIRPPAFASHVAHNLGHISDCTNLDMGNCYLSNPLASSLLRSNYYCGICVKYLVDISRCGGVCAVSSTHGGSKASDERLMESAGYFDESRCQWLYQLCPECDPTDKYCRHKVRHGVLYDGGVDMATIGRCSMHGFRCVKTGAKRTDAKSTLSSVATSIGQERSILRIRVENKTGAPRRR